MKADSSEFIIKTNKEVDEWMDTFYVEGRKAEFRLYCKWAWQEQERRRCALMDELIHALEISEGALLIAEQHLDRGEDDSINFE